MQRTLVVAALACACSGGSSEGGGEGATPVPRAKRVALSLEILPASAEGEIDAGGLVEITLIETDETGSTRRTSLGEFPGPCEDVSKRERGTAMKPLLAARCTGGEGLRMRLVQDNQEIILYRAAGLSGDDFDFDEFRRIEMRAGAAIFAE